MAKSATKSRASDKDLSDLFEHMLKDMYYAEKKIYRSLPKMIRAANDEELKAGLTNHREETAEQIAMLEQIFELIEKRPKAEKCDAMDGILEEAESILEDFGETRAGDAAIIMSAQAVEHYEMTRYGTMLSFAEVLGMKEAVKMIRTILDQEKKADKTLSALAEGRVNYAAEEDSGDEAAAPAKRAASR